MVLVLELPTPGREDGGGVARGGEADGACRAGVMVGGTALDGNERCDWALLARRFMRGIRTLR